MLIAHPAMSPRQSVFHNCGMTGDAKSATAKALNRLKNRFTPPSGLDTSITLAAIVAPGDDHSRWTNNQAAEITGYVHDVMKGGVESCNCHAKDPKYRDTHIELVVDPMDSAETRRVIVEVTPRWRANMKAGGIDWSTAGLRATLLGRWVKVRGWMMFDIEHATEAENTNPGGAGNWRATAWELHPVTAIDVVQRPR